MQTMIMHKWIRYSAILSVLLVWLMFWGPRVEATHFQYMTAILRTPPFGIGQGRRLEVTLFNSVCSEDANFEVSIVNAVDGVEIGRIGPRSFPAKTGKILTLFGSGGTTVRRNIVVEVRVECLGPASRASPPGLETGITAAAGDELGTLRAAASIEVVEAGRSGASSRYHSHR